MPFKKIKRNKYRSPSGRTFSRRQVSRYYARGKKFDARVSFSCDDGKTVLQPSCRCGRNHLRDSVKLIRRDPTQTGDLRKRFSRELDKRWLAVASLIKSAILEEDRWGLGKLSSKAIATIQQSGSQVVDFQAFVEATINHLLLSDDRDKWIASYITPAFERGWKRAQVQSKQEYPVAYQRASIIVALTVTELQGIASAVVQNATRVFSEGLIGKDKPRTIAQRVGAKIISVGRARSRSTAASQIVRAHAEASLDMFELAGIRAVGIAPEYVPAVKVQDAPKKRRLVNLEMVEVLTAGDDLVCDECEEISDDGPYTIIVARGLIPAHPNCRCSFVPADDERFARDTMPPAIEAREYDPEPPLGYLGLDGMKLKRGMQIKINRDATMAHTLQEARTDEPDTILEVDLTRVPRYADLSGVHVPSGIVLTIGSFDPILSVWMVMAT